MNFLFIELIELHVILLNFNMHIALIMKHAGRTENYEVDILWVVALWQN